MYNYWASFTGWHVAEDPTNPRNYIRAVFNPYYYSHGAVRVAHKGQFTHPSSQNGKKIVVKEFISSHAYLKSDWHLDITTAKKAKELAKKFNEVSRETDRLIHFRDVIPLKVCANSWWHNSKTNLGEWVVAEHFLEGNFRKWLSNDGWVSDSAGATLPAFSHWTWVETDGQILVCDLQGVRDNPRGYWLTDNPRGYWLTEAAILSPGQKYGKTDIGNVGIHNFFDSHVCTTICESLGIEEKCPSQRKLQPSRGLRKRGSSYSGEHGVKRHNKFVPKLDAIQ